MDRIVMFAFGVRVQERGMRLNPGDFSRMQILSSFAQVHVGEALDHPSHVRRKRDFDASLRKVTLDVATSSTNIFRSQWWH
jgi:hypothetical protein